jgi:hypothetical protein
MRRRRWYAEQPPVTVSVAAGSEEHRVSWRHGRLVLHDHDVAAEEVLQALGGEPCVCLMLRELFRALKQRPAGYTVAGPGGWRSYRRGVATSSRFTLQPGVSVPVSQPGIPQAAQLLQQVQTSPSFQRLPVEQRNRTLSQLRREVVRQNMPEPLVAILALARQVQQSRWQQRLAAPQRRATVEERLEATAALALEAAMRESQPHLRAQAPINVGCWKQAAGEARILQGDLTSRGGFVAVSLPAHWLNRVYLRGLARVDGLFVLDVDAPAPATELHAEVVHWTRHFGGHAVPTAVEVRITRRHGTWRITDTTRVLD